VSIYQHISSTLGMQGLVQWLTHTSPNQGWTVTALEFQQALHSYFPLLSLQQSVLMRVHMAYGPPAETTARHTRNKHESRHRVAEYAVNQSIKTQDQQCPKPNTLRP
jgi:hypothetical protein